MLLLLLLELDEIVSLYYYPKILALDDNFLPIQVKENTKFPMCVKISLSVLYGCKHAFFKFYSEFVDV